MKYQKIFKFFCINKVQIILNIWKLSEIAFPYSSCSGPLGHLGPTWHTPPPPRPQGQVMARVRPQHPRPYVRSFFFQAVSRLIHAQESRPYSSVSRCCIELCVNYDISVVPTCSFSSSSSSSSSRISSYSVGFFKIQFDFTNVQSRTLLAESC